MDVIDFTTYFISHVADTDVLGLKAAGQDGVLMGFDTSPESSLVRASFVRCGFDLTGFYRFLYWNLGGADQVHRLAQAIHVNPLPLPRYACFDAEENCDANGQVTIAAPSDPIRYFTQVADQCDAEDITANSQTRPLLYTRISWWRDHTGDWDGLAKRGWSLWLSDTVNQSPDTAELCGGFSREQLVGVQWGLNARVSIGYIDYNHFRDPGPGPGPSPSPGPGPLPSPPDVRGRLEALEQFMQSAGTRLDRIERTLEAIKEAIG